MQEGVTSEASANPQKHDTSHENFAALRKKLESLEQQRLKDQKILEEERKRREEFENRLRSLSGVKDESDEDEYSYVSKKELKSFIQSQQEALERKIQEATEKEAYQRKNESFFESHPDFSEVVNEENMNKLEKYDPHFASILALVPDKIQQLKAAYGKVKEMQEKTAPKKSNAPHPYIAASPFGQGATTSVMGSDSMNDPNRRMEARKLLEQMKSSFSRSGA